MDGKIKHREKRKEKGKRKGEYDPDIIIKILCQLFYIAWPFLFIKKVLYDVPGQEIVTM